RVGHTIMVNDGSGDFREESASRFVVADSYSFLGRLTAGNGKLADLDYDGDLDFVAMEMQATDSLHLQIFLNDGTGILEYSQDYFPPFELVDTALGNDTDVTDLDGDGVYDLWVGNGGDKVKLLLNTYEPADGIRADVPRDVEVVSADASGVTIGWTAPPFAANVRHYEVLRSLASQAEARDREKIHVVGLSAHEDEGFQAPITRHTTTADLGDPDVVLDGANDRIELVDRDVEPGMVYFYTVTHVGPEHTVSAQSREVAAETPDAGEPDETAPHLRIASPSSQHWSAFPRIVVEYADGGSGVDVDSLDVSFDQPVGGRSADENLADLFLVKNMRRYIHSVVEGPGLPTGLVTMTVSIADDVGNRTTQSVSFAVTVTSPSPPTASLSASPTSGEAPLTVDFSGESSTDSDGLVMRYDWYYGDDRTGIGRRAPHCYADPGTYDVTLVVRDNEGGVAQATTSIEVLEG
ncbi:MAG: PKD domain-containing protein, partial [Actinobacteria bacterium]|nr:PKD domain-containing protein [Actinomycetota bacterium]